MSEVNISDKEFVQFQKLIYDIAGINMTAAKKPLVAGRLAKRIKHYGLASYADYFRLLSDEGNGGEVQMAVDLLTTNETYFFREPKHFDLLRNRILPSLKGRQTVRVWSGASSSGEEPYSLAMTLDDCLGEQPWELLASDISTRMLEKARAGHYVMNRMENIPRAFLSRYCLKGVGEHEGTFLIHANLRNRVQFRQVNLNEALPKLDPFDVIFLRNVLIYFDMETKKRVVQNLLSLLKPGGYFLVSHSESLNGIADGLQAVAPSVYRKP
jgi:chemotaxis protein methyltransferase CheR